MKHLIIDSSTYQLAVSAWAADSPHDLIAVEFTETYPNTSQEPVTKRWNLTGQQLDQLLMAITDFKKILT
jgi:hypothetical protein